MGRNERGGNPLDGWEAGGMFKAHRHVYHSTLDWRVIKKKEDMYVGGLPRVAGRDL